MNNLVSPSVEIFLALGSVFALLAGLVLLIDSIWRAEDRFDRYLKLMAGVFALLLLKMVLIIFGFDSFENWMVASRAIDLVMSLVFLMAHIKLFRMIRGLSGEAGN